LLGLIKKIGPGEVILDTIAWISSLCTQNSVFVKHLYFLPLQARVLISKTGIPVVSDQPFALIILQDVEGI
jgi:hypothetical protein